MSQDLEAEIRSHFEADELDVAATLAIEGYGPEVLSFLIATQSSRDFACDVFAQMSEDLWRGLPKFEWRSSLRTWMYSLARNAGHRLCRAPQQRVERRIPLSRISEVAAEVQTRTLSLYKTEVKDRFSELRESLDPEDRALLVLRVNRGLSWKETALVIDGLDPTRDADALDRAAARLRQRFRTVRKRLRQQAHDQGIVDDAGR